MTAVLVTCLVAAALCAAIAATEHVVNRRRRHARLRARQQQEWLARLEEHRYRRGLRDAS